MSEAVAVADDVQLIGDIIQAAAAAAAASGEAGDETEQTEKGELIEEPQPTSTDHAEIEGIQDAPAVTSQCSNPDPKRPFQMDRGKVNTESSEKKKEDEKLKIYKALAIKLKKELVKTRDELRRLQEDYKAVVSDLRSKVELLETTLETDRIHHTNTSITLEATCKNLRSKLETAENDLQSLQAEFDSYKTRATKIMQQSNFSPANQSNRTFEEDRYKQLRALNEEQKQQIVGLIAQVTTLTSENKELAQRLDMSRKDAEAAKVQMKEYKDFERKCNRLTKENDGLKHSLNHFKENHHGTGDHSAEQHNINNRPNKSLRQTSDPLTETELADQSTTRLCLVDPDRLINVDENAIQISPCTSMKDDNQTNSSSSFDSSTYGYVHIKPTAFEIISRTSVLEDAQNQIDNLTKAYLDSESTNSLLTEQVSVLKEEIRRIQRGNERMELANNLEYLKNVLFKFLSLDNSQVEQKQRLVPVLGTILKLSPDETQRLNNLTLAEKSGMTSSFFRL